MLGEMRFAGPFVTGLTQIKTRSAQAPTIEGANEQEQCYAMKTRRWFMLMAAAALVGSALPVGAQYLPRVTVYKNPACGCCGEWVKHMQANGFRVETQDVSDVTPLRRKHGVPDSLASCHTAVVAGYTLEGHVPAKDVWRVLRERPAVKGLAVPGMVPGSPGMEQGTPQPFATIAFDGREKRVFAQH